MWSFIDCCYTVGLLILACNPDGMSGRLCNNDIFSVTERGRLTKNLRRWACSIVTAKSGTVYLISSLVHHEGASAELV